MSKTRVMKLGTNELKRYGLYARDGMTTDEWTEIVTHPAHCIRFTARVTLTTAAWQHCNLCPRRPLFSH